MSEVHDLTLTLLEGDAQGDGVPRGQLERERLLKGDDPVAQRSNLLSVSDRMAEQFGAFGAVEPPFDPLVLVRLFGVSNALRQNVDTMVHNVHGGGHTFEPVIDLDAADARETVRMAMLLERERQAELDAEDGDDVEDIDEPTDKEVEERVEGLRNQMRREAARLRAFFDFAAVGCSFVRLRRRLGTDQETTGWAAWEVLRDRRGLPRRLVFAPAWTLRAMPLGEHIEVESHQRITDISWEPVQEARRFRRYVQIYEEQITYFKEFGDPRVMSAETGRYFKDEKVLRRAEGEKARIATELLWFALDNPESDVYGLVKWSGNILSVVGSREMEEINLLFFDNKAIPPMVVMVSGGHLAADAKEELQQVIRDQIKGRKNFHRILVIEAEPSATAAAISGLPGQQSVRIELKPLTEHIFADQLWGEYDEANRHKVGQSFRVPPILRGDTKDFNRATATAALQYAEQQVFGPERDDFDFEINRTIVRDLGVTLLRFVSKATSGPDPDAVLEKVAKLVESTVGIDEARRMVSTAMGATLPPYGTSWSKVPLRQSLAGMEPAEEEEEDDLDLDPPEKEPEEDADEEQVEEEKADSPPVTRLRIPAEQFDRLFETDQ